MVGCNPETVSTDYDTSDKLYFEPLTLEDVLSIYQKEKPLGVIVQFGGQTPLNLANDLARTGVTILGTSPETIDLAEDRDRFRKVMDRMGIPQPESGMAADLEKALAIEQRIGYPLMVRPSYVLGGRAMMIVLEKKCCAAISHGCGCFSRRPILIDKFPKRHRGGSGCDLGRRTVFIPPSYGTSVRRHSLGRFLVRHPSCGHRRTTFGHHRQIQQSRRAER